MVDPKNTNERTIDTEARRKEWVTPRIETADLTDTAGALGKTTADGGGTCLS